MIYLWIYVFLTALSVVSIHHAGAFIPPSLTLFFSVMLAMIIFHVLNLRHLKKIYQHCWQHKSLWWGVMGSVAVMWLGTVYGAPCINPSVFVLLYFMPISLCGILVDYRAAPHRYFLYAGFGLVLCVIVLSSDYLMNVHFSWLTVMGLGLAILSGIGAFFYTRQSYTFSKRTGLTSTQVLAVRFWLVAVLCFFMLPTHPESYLSWKAVGSMSIVSLSAFILPVFFYLKGVLKIGPITSSMLVGAIPAVAYLLQSLITHQIQPVLLFLYLLSGFFLALPSILKGFQV